MADTLYLKMEQNTEVEKADVTIKDAGKILCTNRQMEDRINTIKIHKFTIKSPQKCVISVLEIIEKIQEIYPAITVENIGETDILVEKIKTNREKGVWQVVKIIFVSLISFFGTAFTIMAYHNDVGISEVFAKIYENFTGQGSSGCTVLEISYSIGLAVGMVLFFNHIGGRRITKDPTPIEVEMRIYEQEVNTALIQTASREGKTIDVK